MNYYGKGSLSSHLGNPQWSSTSHLLPPSPTYLMSLWRKQLGGSFLTVLVLARSRFWVPAVSSLMVGWFQAAKTTSPLLLRPKVHNCVCVLKEGGRVGALLFTALGRGDAARGYSGDRPRLSGGPSREGGGQLEANVLHHDRSIVARLARVLLCTRGLDLTLAISLSLHITLNHHHPSEKGHKIGQSFL